MKIRMGKVGADPNDPTQWTDLGVISGSVFVPTRHNTVDGTVKSFLGLLSLASVLPPSEELTITCDAEFDREALSEFVKNWLKVQPVGRLRTCTICGKVIANGDRHFRRHHRERAARRKAARAIAAAYAQGRHQKATALIYQACRKGLF